MLDFHNHLMPGVDDGPVSIEESRSGLKAMAADGIAGIITTPHISASLSGASLERYLDRVNQAWESLVVLATTEFPQLRINRGFEVMLDTPHPVLDDPIYRLAGTQFVLVEFPFMSIPPNCAYAVRQLREAGWIPIVAHPERYYNMESAMHLIEQWRDAGAYLQLNSGSFLGSYGARAKRLAWTILGEGHAEYMCSDYHSRGRCTVAGALSALKERGFDEQVSTIVDNGKRLVGGQRPLPVTPMEEKPKPGWKKAFPWI